MPTQGERAPLTVQKLMVTTLAITHVLATLLIQKKLITQA